MGLLTFKGGIHPDDGKRFSKDSEIRTLLPKGELAYPLSQHIGAPANPIVKKGDHVLKGQKIAEALGDTEKAAYFAKEAKEKTEAAKKYLLDPDKGLFVSGEEKQLNYASQVWMILAGAVSAEEGAEILDKVIALNPEKGMVSPYMNHHFVEALLKCGKKEQAMDYMKYYWGGMLSHGADTFWELYNPENPAESPYGGSMVNSYCHAWSCTPTYLLRKYFI